MVGLLLGMNCLPGNYLKETGNMPRDYMPAEFPFPPLPKKLTGRMIKSVTVPGGSAWKCTLCGRPLKGGEYAGKLGRIILCPECIRKGK